MDPAVTEDVPAGTPPFQPPRPAPGAPNVVMIVLDDTGFAQLGCFGGDLDTPNIDALAAAGLRYNTFHVTAICSPTRACLLTGRNHHAVGMGFLADIATAQPGYAARLPKTAAALPRVLRDAGYSTLAVGKWHLTTRGERSAAGPFDHWPLGIGFERYYGFLGGGTNAWAPNLVADNHFVEPPATPAEGYHVDEDLADQAIRFVRDQKHAAPDKPFLLYWSPLATHAPHHVAPEWVEPYEGRFDDGWERYRERVFARQVDQGIVPAGTRLSPRPSWVEDWAGLDDEARRVFTRMHELYGGFVTHIDAQIGRFLDFLRSIDQLDDTIVMVLSDNGASAEGGPLGTWNEHRFTTALPESIDDLSGRLDDLGGPRTYPHYAWGWAWAGNTPFRLWKRYTWLGGTRTPLVVCWPAGIEDRGAVRSQFCHAIDLMPTVLDACGIDAPGEVDGVAQQPLHGASLLSTFVDPDTPSPRDTQYFEMLGSRSIWSEGWKATTDHVSAGVAAERELIAGSHDFDHDRWELFDLTADFAESTDVGAEHPEVLARLRDLWQHEAERNAVLPLADDLVARVADLVEPPHPPPTRAIYRPGGAPVADEAMPPLTAGFEIAASVTVAAGGPDGIVVVLGDALRGFALYGLRGRLVVAMSLAGDLVRVESPPIGDGARVLRLRYRRHDAGDGSGELELVDGDRLLAAADVPRPLPVAWQHGGTGLRIGHDAGLAVTDDYEPPFPWTGAIDRVEVFGGVPDASAGEEAAADALHAD